ncbi:hypothetical protein HRbin22_01684 [Candidatus Thermoflexus japonica]|uniref:Uncharacterized protein n=1 Tax=Candidatus Thermoflexus japonica TaxID=2035417 RepID=A0A2H5Y7L5_9CHLR|nr:hypothetical protein HRbin22_01684 [Candidatus Thermoflexus japonica]
MISINGAVEGMASASMSSTPMKAPTMKISLWAKLMNCNTP